MSVAAITSIYGDYDELPPVPEQTLGADWICVTDRPHSGSDWQVIVEPRPHMHPRLAAKVAKCLPHRYTTAETVVWLDGACRLTDGDALSQIVAAAAEGSEPIAQVAHPDRDCIFDEGVASIGMPKYDGQNIAEQLVHYQAQGHPPHWGLWATGLIVRSYRDPYSSQFHDHFGHGWLSEQMRWTYQDQLSEPVLLRLFEHTPTGLPWPLRGSPLFEWLGHASAL